MNTPKKPTAIRLILGGGLILALLVTVFYGARFILEKNNHTRAQSRLNLYHTTLTNALDRYRHLPFVLAQDSFIKAALYDIGIGVLNDRLAALVKRTDLSAIYLMNLNGLTVAASNFDQPQTFIGKNYEFRPYFQSARQGRSGQFFAIGVTTQKPGYFLSQPVYDATGEIIGVITIKVDLSNLSRIWAESGDSLFVSNVDTVIVLASNRQWQYQTLTPLDRQRLKNIKQARQFQGQSLNALDWRKPTPGTAILRDKSYLHLTRPIENPRWTLHFLAPRAQSVIGAVLAMGAAGALIIALLAGMQLVRARRIRVALTSSQTERRKLARINTRLEREIIERRAAETRAAKATKRLAKASKLATLGQLSASVTHELGQPISAMKTYLVAAEMQKESSKSDLIARLNGLVMRMESITQDLRFFAKPGPRNFECFDVSVLIRGAVRMMSADMKAHNINFSQTLAPTAMFVDGNRFRLEQVLINLIKNALSAILNSNNSTAPAVNLDVTTQESLLVIRVTDTGAGLQGRNFETLQEPFHTTRASGEGMGLGLAISAEIVKEHNGTITAYDRDDIDHGAVFILKLPLANNRSLKND